MYVQFQILIICMYVHTYFTNNIINTIILLILEWILNAKTLVSHHRPSTRHNFNIYNVLILINLIPITKDVCAAFCTCSCSSYIQHNWGVRCIYSSLYYVRETFQKILKLQAGNLIRIHNLTISLIYKAICTKWLWVSVFSSK